MNSLATRKITSRAAETGKRVVLPESSDPRVLRAAREITDCKYANVVLLGDEAEISRQAKRLALSIEGVEILNFLEDDAFEQYARNLHERRKAKGMTLDDARELLTQPVYYAAMMVGAGRVDGMVAGSICPTRDTVRSATFGVGLAEGNRTVSACSV